MSNVVEIPLSRQVGARRSPRRSGRGTSSRAAWRAPLRRARRAINSTIARIETSGRVIEATARFAPGHPLQTARRLQRLIRWMDEAYARLELAIQRFHVSIGLVAQDPERAEAAMALLADTALRFAEATARLDATYAHIVDVAERLPFDAPVAPPSIPARPAHVRCAPLRPAPVVLIRRRSFVVTFAAEIAIELCRGRAPPCDSTVLATHRS